MAKGEKFDNVRLDTSRNGQTFIYTFSAKLPLSIGDNYLLQAISSLGFIGTVLGLSVAIGLGDQAKTEQGMGLITQNLNVAFDTTIVALVLGLFLTYRYHSYLEKLDTFFSQTKSYILDNLISRIYKG